MQRPAPTKSRKLLVASLGVASMTYVATTALLPACGGSTRSSAFGNGGDDSGEVNDSTATDDYPMGNLAIPQDAPSDALQIDDFPVANLAVMPDAGMPDASTPDAGTPDVGTADVSTG
jgi:hypothetical protein